MNDKLEKMFEMQEAFMQRLKSIQDGFPQQWPLDLRTKQAQIDCKNVVFDSMQELFEAIRELKNSKKHRQTELNEFDRAKFGEECVDAFKFFLELLIFVGITPDELFDMYCKKDAAIHRRIDERY